jgi:hypothetical protein
MPDGGATYELVVRRAAGGVTTAVADAGEAPRVEGGAVLIPVAPGGGTRRVEIALGDDVGPRYQARGAGAG